MNQLTRFRVFSFILILSILFGAVGLRAQVVHAAGTVSLTLGTTYTENFDTLANTGTSSVVPNGWYFSESDTNANTTYAAGSGSSTTGDTYSFGVNGNTERAFGELRSGSLITTIGANFSNASGVAITSLVITYTGEQWRLGAVGRTDRMDFQYSTDATSLTTGTWTNVDPLDLTAPVTSGTVGSLDGNLSANRTVITSTITGLNIPNGSTFWIRWTDLDASGSDDGLAVDDFSLTPISVVDTTTADFNAGTPGDCVVDGGVGDGALKINLPLLSCVFTSRVHNAGVLVDWTILAATTTTPVGTSISFDTRTGNTASPDISWTNWQAANGTLTNPGSQYIQYRAILATTDSGQTPVIEDVKINFISGNISSLTSPEGTLTSWNGSFTWTGVNGATWYLLEVYTPSMTQLHRKWYTSAQANCSAGTACSLTTSELSLLNGNYQWRVMDYGAYGYGIWPHFKPFSLSASCNTLTWYVNPADSGSVTAPAQTCAGGYLSGTVAQVNAIPGTGYTFLNWSGDAGGSANPVLVTMDGPKTVTANMRGNTPLTPSGTLTSWNGSFTWTGLSDATWYLLEVQTLGGSQVFRKWYTSIQTGCSGGTACSITPSGLSLANIDYKWRILDYGAYGYGINSAFKNFSLDSACYTLTTNVSPESSGVVNIPSQSCAGGFIAGSVMQLTAVPGTGYTFLSWGGDADGTTNPLSITMDANKTVTANMRGNTPLSPSGTLTSWNGTYTWTGLSDATWYLLEVQTSGGTQIFRKWYTSAQTGCSGGTNCSIVPPETLYLPNSDYKWHVMDYGAYGYGINSAFKEFTLNVTAVCGDILYVDVDSPASTPDGCSWGTAYKTLQDALSLAASGKQVWVAEGTYYPDRGGGQSLGDRNANFGLKTGVAIYGGFKGNEAVLNARDKNPATNGTILSGDIGTEGVTSDNSYQVVRGDTVSSAAILDGFTITRGNSNGSSGHGGGIYLTGSSPTLANLTISSNLAAANGGGVYVITANNALPETSYSRPSFTDVTFSGNTAARGGGMYTQNASPVLTRVVFTGNTASSGAGGGMNNQTLTSADAPSIPVLTDVTFSTNAANGGGGMFISNSAPLITNATFNGNTANRRGGGILNENGGNPSLTNVTFYNNISNDNLTDPRGGGAIMNITSSPILNNVTFNGNNSLVVGGDAIRNAVNSNPVIRNSILWGDVNDEITSDGTGTLTISDSVVQGDLSGRTDIITTDPKLVPLANNGGFTQTMALGAGSSAVDAGNNSYCGIGTSDQRGTPRPQGLACDIGAYELDKVLLIAPSGPLEVWNNTFSWTGQSDATWYLLEVYTADSSTQVFRKWYTSAQTGCSGLVACWVSPPETAGLATGSYKWRILEYGSFGYGIWTQYMNFTLGQ